MLVSMILTVIRVISEKRSLVSIRIRDFPNVSQTVNLLNPVEKKDINGQ